MNEKPIAPESIVVRYKYGDNTIVYIARLQDMKDAGEGTLQGIAELSVRVRRENFTASEETWFEEDLDCEEKMTFLDDQNLDIQCEAEVAYAANSCPNYIKHLKELGMAENRDIPRVLLVDMFLPLEERLRRQLQDKLEEITINFDVPALQPNT